MPQGCGFSMMSRSKRLLGEGRVPDDLFVDVFVLHVSEEEQNEVREVGSDEVGVAEVVEHGVDDGVAELVVGLFDELHEEHVAFVFVAFEALGVVAGLWVSRGYGCR